MAGPARYPKARRLRASSQYDRVQDGADTRRGSSPHFLVLLSPSVESGGGARLGVIASRRVGSAVRRNRAKRLIREFFRANAETLGDYDMVVVAHPGAHTLSAADAAAELRVALDRARAATPGARPAARTRTGAGRKGRA